MLFFLNVINLVNIRMYRILIESFFQQYVDQIAF